MIPRIALSGAIDFAAADLRDTKFWDQLRVLGEAITDDKVIELRRAELLTAASLLQASGDSGRSLEAAANRVDKVTESLRKELFPWSKSNPSNNVLDKMSQALYATYGDPSDPAVKSKIEAATAALWRSNKSAAAKARRQVD